MSVPLPITHHSPCLTRFCPSSMDFHINDGLYPCPASMALVVGKYLPFKSDATKLLGLFGLLKILQNCFPSNTKLKFSIPRNPSPHSFFGKPILCHETQDLLLVPLLHQYSAKTRLISSQVPFGSLKQFLV